jgi:hypothetical protein
LLQNPGVRAVAVQLQPFKVFWQVALTGAPGPVPPVGGATVPTQYGALQLTSLGQPPSSPCSSTSLGLIYPHAASVVVAIVVVGEHPIVFEVLVVTQSSPPPEAVAIHSTQ